MFVFSKEWFQLHQNKLIFLLNNPITKDWFRSKLYIDGNKSSVQERHIVKIEPNAITWLEDIKSDNTPIFSTEFRCKPKFSNRLFYAFNPIWNFFHKIDELFIDKYAPELSFGFSTLTAYPDADAETTTVDGTVYRLTGSYNISWANIRAGASNGTNYATPSASPGNFVSLKYGDSGWWELYRAIYLFNTSGLTTKASISGATLSLWATTKGNYINTNDTVCIVTSTPATNTNLVAADYLQVGTTLQSNTTIAFNSFNTGVYSNFAFNASGISSISKTGISKFGSCTNGDATATEPTHPYTRATSNVTGYFAEQTGTTNDPKLVVTYEIPLVSVMDTQYRRRHI